MPGEIHRGYRRGDDALHAFLDNVDVHEVAVLGESIFYAPLRSVAEVELHQDGAVVELHGCEVELAGLKALCRRGESEAVEVGLGRKESDFGRVIAVVVAESGARNHTALVGELEAEHLVFEFHRSAVAVRCGGRNRGSGPR